MRRKRSTCGYAVHDERVECGAEGQVVCRAQGAAAQLLEAEAAHAIGCNWHKHGARRSRHWHLHRRWLRPCGRKRGEGAGEHVMGIMAACVKAVEGGGRYLAIVFAAVEGNDVAGGDKLGDEGGEECLERFRCADKWREQGEKKRMKGGGNEGGGGCVAWRLRPAR